MDDRKIIQICLAILACFPSLVFAHSEGASEGFLSGLLHPVFGYDHFLAMLSVGIVSAQLGGRDIWMIPSVFVLAMIFGGVMGGYSVEIPLVEMGIAISVIILGIAIILADGGVHGSGSILIKAFVAFFGVFHGHAHGVEMPRSADPVFYVFGFVISTCSIHLLGVLIGYVFVEQRQWAHILKVAGAGVAGAGLFILIN
ncbi:MAG: HupE/UreJ family protein [Exilibacterium sp.]